MVTLQSLKDEGRLADPGSVRPAVLIVPCRSQQACKPDFHVVGTLELQGPNGSWVVKQPSGRFTCVQGEMAIPAGLAAELGLSRPCREADRKPLELHAAHIVASGLLKLYASAENPTEAQFRRFWRCNTRACRGYRFSQYPVLRKQARKGDVPLIIASIVTAFFRDNLLICDGRCS